ncbi:MAG: dipicolinate synthase [Clostridia bacterium]|nr:dipicolinate synthase [Clostridia bacterium]
MIETWNKTAVLGGDRRQLAAAAYLAARGHEVAVWGIDGETSAFGKAVRVLDWQSAIRGAGVILLPLPVSPDGVRIHTLGEHAESAELRFTHLLGSLTHEQRIFAGRVQPNLKAAAEERAISLTDYSENELFQIRNARPTAEGAIEIAWYELQVTLAGTSAAVIGYGRIGRTLARLLSALEANITVAARKSTDLAWIADAQWTPLPIVASKGENSLCALADCRVIFNTVPHWLFSREVLCSLRRDVVLIDLASSPGGVDPQAAAECGIRVIRALSLPGKCAPESAGEIIAQTVLALMEREGVSPQ